jgi:hypothetical protein
VVKELTKMESRRKKRFVKIPLKVKKMVLMAHQRTIVPPSQPGLRVGHSRLGYFWLAVFLSVDLADWLSLPWIMVWISHIQNICDSWLYFHFPSGLLPTLDYFHAPQGPFHRLIHFHILSVPWYFLVYHVSLKWEPPPHGT